MSTLVTRFVLAGTKEEVSPARHMIVDTVRAWGVPLDEETVDAILLVASELITNAVVHGEGPVAVSLCHRTGSLVIDVFDSNLDEPKPSYPDTEAESGRGLGLVDFIAVRSGCEFVECGKHVWADIALPKSASAIRAAVLRRFFTARPGLHAAAAPGTRTLAMA